MTEVGRIVLEMSLKRLQEDRPTINCSRLSESAAGLVSAS